MSGQVATYGNVWLEKRNLKRNERFLTDQKVLPVRIFFCIVTTKAEVKVFADVAVDPAAYDEALAVVTGVFHVDHLMVVLMALRLGTAWSKTCSITLQLHCTYAPFPGYNCCSEEWELTEEACLAQVHIHALQTSVAVPRCHPFTAVTGNYDIEQVTITCNKHVHLWGKSQSKQCGQLYSCLYAVYLYH